MKRFPFGLFALVGTLLSVAVPAQAQQTGPIYCGDQAFTAQITTATTTSVIAQPATGSAKIYICGWNFYLGTNSGATRQFEYGTQTSTPCDTGATAAAPQYPIGAASNTVVGDASPFFRGFVIPAGKQLCVVTTTSSSVAVAVQVFYEQY
jgi:hypothetical protein